MISEFNSRLKAVEKVASVESNDDILLRKLSAFKDYCEAPSGSTKRAALKAWHRLDPTESAIKIAEVIEQRIALAKKTSIENQNIAMLAGWQDYGGGLCR